MKNWKLNKNTRTKYMLDLSEIMCDEVLHLKTIYSSTLHKSTEIPLLELLNFRENI